jgi:hypothetical protein
MADSACYIELASNAGDFFTNADQDDILIHPQYATQKILLGTTNSQISSITVTSNAIGILNSSPAYTLDVQGDINFTGSFFENGTPYIGSQWSNSDSNVFLLSSNVGIGKSNPMTALDVTGTVTATTFAGATINSLTNLGAYSSNTANFGSNTAVAASNSARFGSNTAVSGCNAAMWSSNNLLNKAGGTITGSLDVTGTTRAFGALELGPTAMRISTYSLQLGSGTSQIGKLVFNGGSNMCMKVIVTTNRTTVTGENALYEEYEVVWNGVSGVTPQITTAKQFQQAQSVGAGVNAGQWYYDSATNVLTLCHVRNLTHFYLMSYECIGLYPNATANNDTSMPAGSMLTPAFIVDRNRNVGIGLSNPAYQLDVTGTARATTGIVGNIVLNGASETFNGQGGSGNQTLSNYLRFNTGRQHSIISDGLDNLQIWWGAGNSYAPRWQFGQSTSYCLLGNFGIGTSNPGYTLDVAGAARASNLYAGTAIGVGTTTPGACLHIYNSNSARTALIVDDDNVYEYPAAAMTSNATYIANTVYGEGLYIASASTISSSIYEPYGAFNKAGGGSSSGTVWITANTTYNGVTGAYSGSLSTNGYAGEWLQIQLPSPVFMTSFRLTSRSHATRGDPKDFAVFASHDGQVWVRVHVISGEVFTSNETKSYTVTTPSAPCKYFRLVINTITPYTSAAWASVGEWYIHGVANTTQQLTVRSDQVALDNVKVAIGNKYPTTALQVFETSSASGFEFPPFAMTTDTTTRFDAKYGNGTYVASASTIQNSSYPASGAFAKVNATLSNCWASSNTYNSSTGVYTGSVFTTHSAGSNYLGEHLQIQVPEPMTLNNLQFSSRNSTTRGDPKSWAVFGSMDGATFTQLFATTTEPSWAIATPRTYTISSVVPYSYYRLAVNETYSVGTVGYVSVADLRLYGKTQSKVNHLQVSNGVVQVSEYANLGVGTATPAYKLDVNGDINYTGSLLKSGVALAGSQWTSSACNVYIGSTSNVGIGTTAPGYTLHVVGTIYTSGDVIALSDERAKSNLEVILEPLSKVHGLTGYTYDMIESVSDTTKLTSKYTGLIAQQVMQVLPEAVHKDTDGKLSIAYGNIMGLVVEAIKAVDNKYKEEIQTLKNQMAQVLAKS